MRHAKARYQLNRFTSWRKATVISLAKSLIIHQSIRTTKTRAKAARPLVEKLITLAKQNSLAAKRQAYKVLGDHRLVSLLFGDIGQRFTKKSGGYTRIIGLKSRRGDNAECAILELTAIKKKELPSRPEKIKEAKEIKEIKEVTKSEEEKKHVPEPAIKEKPPITKKPAKNFLGGLKNIFKKERDSL